MKRRVLLVEDDVPKQSQIADALALADVSIDHAASVNEAIRRLDAVKYDCILLDMSLPTFTEGAGFFSGGRQQDFGGRHILTYMWEMEIDSRVLIVTQLPGFKNDDGIEVRLSDLDATLRQDFPGLYAGFVSFHHSSDSWVRGISDFIEGKV